MNLIRRPDLKQWTQERCANGDQQTLLTPILKFTGMILRPAQFLEGAKQQWIASRTRSNGGAGSQGRALFKPLQLPKRILGAEAAGVGFAGARSARVRKLRLLVCRLKFACLMRIATGVMRLRSIWTEARFSGWIR